MWNSKFHSWAEKFRVPGSSFPYLISRTPWGVSIGFLHNQPYFNRRSKFANKLNDSFRKSYSQEEKWEILGDLKNPILDVNLFSLPWRFSLILGELHSMIVERQYCLWMMRCRWESEPDIRNVWHQIYRWHTDHRGTATTTSWHKLRINQYHQKCPQDACKPNP